MQYRIRLTPRIQDLLRRLGKDAGEARVVALRDVVSTVEAHTVKEEARHAITSNLVNSITSYIAKGIGWLRATASYSSFVHDGTRPHEIKPRDKKALSWPGGRHPVKSVQHPGFAGRPFFDIGLQRTNVEAVYDASLQSFLTRRGW